jgi:class 3 adenylate cyclase/tetratricopeptide (TPR) repeat protein
MPCPQCQQENPRSAKFCNACGAALELRCGGCGHANPAASRFCNECGRPLDRGATPTGRFASPQAYTPKHLAERILTSRGALEGERKQVTVLFADVKGSMELLADRDPEEARRILDPALERMMDAVHRYEGTVNQVMGDGIMALFGAPLACEDHAVRACYAALRMQESAKRYADAVRRAEGVPIQIRVGLNSGEVVVRSIGSDLHMDYTAVGQTTHVAARMEQMAVPGSILLSSGTVALAASYVEIKPLGPLPVKGLETPMEVYELIQATTIRSRFQAAAARGLTRFVGRDSEMDQLCQVLERARTGHGQVVAIVGEPGVGKSRLYWEFSHSHRAQGWLVLESGSVSYGKATSYLPIIELLRAYFSIESADDTRKIQEKVTGKLLSLDRQLEHCISPVLWLLDVLVEDEKWARLDAPQRRQRILNAVKLLLLRESQVRPLMVLFEDLHWIDDESQVLLDSLVESLPTARVLLLVNYRPEYSHGWVSKTYYRQLQIDPLSPESAEALLDAVLGSDSALDALKGLLIERTEGNPFFMEESIRSLVETGVLAGERGAYRLTRAVPVLQVPATAQAMLASRIDRLTPEDKRLLQAASVIGTDVPYELLRALAEEPEDRLRRGLAKLQTTEFLYETRLFPELEYTFRHALTHEVAYGSLLTDRRRDLHARIVGAIETVYGDRLDEHVERLAHHALRGELWDKALTYLRQAGTKAAARSAHREAVVCFEQALAALTHLAQTRETLEQAADLRIDLRNSLWPLGELEKVRAFLREAEGLAKTLNDPRRLGWVSMYMSSSLWVTGHSAEARTFGESALSIAEALPDLPLKVAATLYLGTACLNLGDYRPAEGFLRSTVQSLEGNLSRERCGLAGFPGAMARSYLAMALAERGEFNEGSSQGQEGVRIAEALDHAYSMVVACRGLAFLYGVKGEISRAVRLLERALALSRDWNLTFLLPSVTGFLGSLYTRSQRVPEGLRLLEQTLRAGADWESAFRVIQLGEACILAARFEDSLALAREALTLTRKRGERGYEAHALRLLGEIASHHHRADVGEAEHYYRQALALADELAMRPLVAHCHLGLGKLYERTSERAKAGDALATAATMYREMDMRFWLEKAEAGLVTAR